MSVEGILQIPSCCGQHFCTTITSLFKVWWKSKELSMNPLKGAPSKPLGLGGRRMWFVRSWCIILACFLLLLPPLRHISFILRLRSLPCVCHSIETAIFNVLKNNYAINCKHIMEEVYMGRIIKRLWTVLMKYLYCLLLSSRKCKRGLQVVPRRYRWTMPEIFRPLRVVGWCILICKHNEPNHSRHCHIRKICYCCCSLA